jgi:hypothetical protein
MMGVTLRHSFEVSKSLTFFFQSDQQQIKQTDTVFFEILWFVGLELAPKKIVSFK